MTIQRPACEPFAAGRTRARRYAPTSYTNQAESTLSNQPFNRLPEPTAETRIWRYMSLDKFLDLIISRTLHFARLDRLGDPYEGIPSQSELRGLTEFFRGIDERHPIENRIPVEISTADLMGQSFEFVRKSIFVNCWHANSGEDMAMWKMYGSAGEAIRSTFTRLKESFRGPAGIEIRAGMVEYGDDFPYDPENPASMSAMALRKRACFSSERELRALFFCDLFLPVGENDDSYPDPAGNRIRPGSRSMSTPMCLSRPSMWPQRIRSGWYRSSNRSCRHTGSRNRSSTRCYSRRRRG
jgi:hypothetical protein